MEAPQKASGQAAIDNVPNVQQTTCCVVGGGPGGMMIALLLARQGISVTLLEAHQDFDRQFRGDTLHPAILEILDQIGLADRLHQLRHAKIEGGALSTPHGPDAIFDLHWIKTRFPYIMLIPQEEFLDFLAAEARKYPSFRLVMGANVQQLIEEDGVVRGVRYRAPGGWHEVRALLTVGADGRFSMIRHLAGITPSRRPRRLTSCGSVYHGCQKTPILSGPPRHSPRRQRTSKGQACRQGKASASSGAA